MTETTPTPPPRRNHQPATSTEQLALVEARRRMALIRQEIQDSKCASETHNQEKVRL